MTRKNCIAYGLTLTLGLVVATVAVADDPKTVERTVNKIDSTQVGTLDEVTSGSNIRASQLTGMNIQNEKGESVGEIHDLVVDANTGKIRYAAVTYGGFLGLGDKMFAVPFEAFQCKVDPDDRDEHILVLNVTQKQMEGAKGFDQAHWPNFADKTFTSELDKRYGVDRTHNADRHRVGRRDRDVDVNVNRNGVDVDVKRDRDN